MLNPFKLVAPTTVAEAAAELGRLGDAARIYAGGAELILLLRHGLVRAEYLIDVKRIGELAAIASDNGVVHLGATATHRRLEREPIVRERLPTLAEAESHVGNVRVRTQGTLGGNLCFADPHADPPTALLLHDTTARIAGPGGERQLPLDEFLVGTYETALEPDELLVGLDVRPLAPGWKAAFLRIERFYRPTANVAVAARLERGQIVEARLAVGCVGPQAMRLGELEVELAGLSLADARGKLRESKRYLSDRLEPVDDLLGSAEYKVHLTSVLLGRALEQAWSGEDGGQYA